MPPPTNAQLGIEFSGVSKHPMESRDEYESREAQLRKEFEDDLYDQKPTLTLEKLKGIRIERAEDRQRTSVVKLVRKSSQMMEVFQWTNSHDVRSAQTDYAISACFRKLESLEKKFDELLLALHYAPDGPGARAAQADFEQRAAASDSGDACNKQKRVQ